MFQPISIQLESVGKMNGLHAISRSAEFLSCARTSLRIEQHRQQEIVHNQLLGISVSSSKNNIFPSKLSYIDHNSLKLFDNSSVSQEQQLQECDKGRKNEALEALKDTNSLLSILDNILSKLSDLVKNRGRTNDPTHEINICVSDFHGYYNDLANFLTNVIPNAARKSLQDGEITSNQRKKHYETVVIILRKESEKRFNYFKLAMNQRGEAIMDMTKRRQRLFNSDIQERKKITISGNVGSNIYSKSNISGQKSALMTGCTKSVTSDQYMISDYNSLVTTSNRTKIPLESQISSPLFLMTDANSSFMMPFSGINIDNSLPPSNHVKFNGKYNNLSNEKYNDLLIDGKKREGFQEYGGYGGYYAYCNPSNSFGVRRRCGEITHSKHLGRSYHSEIISTEGDINVGSEKSIMMKQIKRPLSRLSSSRLVAAEATERSLSELTKLFSSMSTLILSQDEILTRIEDDIEMTIGEIETGSSEISKLYISTKSKRHLILKVFGIMIFLIISMRIYY